MVWNGKGCTADPYGFGVWEMNSLKKRIQSAIISVLNEASFSLEIEPIHGPMDVKALESNDLKVVVVAVPLQRKRLAKNRIEWDFEVKIGIAKRVGFTEGEINQDEFDDVMKLSEEIADAVDVHLTIEGAAEGGQLVPEVFYDDEDSYFVGKGIAAAMVTSPYKVWIKRGL